MCLEFIAKRDEVLAKLRKTDYWHLFKQFFDRTQYIQTSVSVAPMVTTFRSFSSGIDGYRTN